MYICHELFSGFTGVRLIHSEDVLFSVNRRPSEIRGTAGVVQSRHAFLAGYSEHVGKMTDTRKNKAEKASEMLIKHSLFVGNRHIG